MFGLYFGKQQNDLKCIVCQKVVESIITSIEQEDPKKKIQVGSFRIEPDGSQKQYEVKYAGSEVHLNEILETVCNSLDDYAQAKHKETGELTLLNLAKDVEKLSLYDLVPDPELNRGLKSSCETFVGDYDDEILTTMQSSSSIPLQDSPFHLCKTVAGYCEASRFPSATEHSEL